MYGRTDLERVRTIPELLLPVKIHRDISNLDLIDLIIARVRRVT
jgi:hypothetical protein